MNMDNLKTWLVIFLVVALAGGMLGPMIWSNNDSNSALVATDTNSTTNVSNTVDSQVFEYSTEFDANVIKVEKTVRFYSDINLSKITSIDDVDKVVGKITGILRITKSEFFPYLDKQYAYSAEITLRDGADLTAIGTELKDIVYFTGQQSLLKYVTVSPPEKIELTLDNNFSRNYSFSTKSIPVLVGGSVSVNDLVKVHGTIKLQNNDIILVELFGENVAQNQFMFDINLPIKSFDKDLIFNATRNTIFFADKNNLENDFNKIDSNIMFNLTNTGKISVMVDLNNQNDLNFITDLNQLNINSTLNNNILEITTDQNMMLVNSLILKYFDENKITYPTETISGKVNEDKYNSLKELLETNYSLTSKKLAYFDLAKVFSIDLNKEVTFEKSSFTTMVNMTDVLDQNVNLSIYAVASGDTAQIRLAIEK
ncbi:MAG: hypothetical protein PHQ98_01610 [Candidatus ainarchaeum sp.]|nr:hypothetical protein [Candidatus ainarchaeum sp.]